MSQKTKKQVVSTQCLAHHIFLEICIFKFVCIPCSLAHKHCKPFIIEWMQNFEAYNMYTLEGHVELGTIYRLSMLIFVLYAQQCCHVFHLDISHWHRPY